MNDCYRQAFRLAMLEDNLKTEVFDHDGSSFSCDPAF